MANRRFIDFPIASSVGDNDIVLIWQDGMNKQTTKGTLIQGAPTSLEGLTDVDIAGLINGQILQYNSTTGKWENVDRTDINLSQLGDVSIVSPSNGQVLVYNSSTSKWENSSGGYVPYTGAVTTVDLGAQTIQAGSFVKVGGTSAQFLKADGSIDSSTYLTTGSAAATYVPYTGATADVNLGTHDLTAERGTFANNGSSDTLTVNHTSGSGYGIIVTKGGNNEALYVSKTSGSGNAMTVVGGRTSLVDLALSSVTNTAGDFLTLSGGVVHKRTAAEVRTDIGAGTVTSVGLSSATSGVTIGSTPVTTSGTITLAIATASGSQNGLLSSTDWTTFNSKIGGTLATSQVAFGTATNTIGGDSGLIYDNTNKRLGVGTLTPLGIFTSSGTNAAHGTTGIPTIPTLLLFRSTSSTSNYAGLVIETQAAGSNFGLYSNQNGVLFYHGDTERWRITSTGILQSNGAQTIQTSTGNLTLTSADNTGIVDIRRTDQRNGAELRLTNSFNGSGWLPGDVVGTLNFVSTDTSHTEPIRSQIKAFSSLGSTNPFSMNLSFSTANGNTLTEGFRLSPSSNLLVGTTTDAGFRLDVNGSTRLDGLSTIRGTAASDSGQLGAELLTTGTGDASWTGTDFATGYTHVAGSTTTLTSTLAGVVNTANQITYTVTGRTAGSFTIAFGGFISGNLTATGSVGPRATTTGTLVITPTSDFDGTIVLSIRVISVSSPSVSFRSSANTLTNDIRISSLVSNTFIGLNAGRLNTTAINNTLIGSSAGAFNTTGSGNTFVGSNSGFANTTGASNSFFGASSGLANTTGVFNSFFGASSGGSNTIGIQNSFFGTNAGGFNSTGNNNSLFGQNSALNNTTGSNNTIIGFEAGRFTGSGTTAMTSINNSIYLGYRTRGLNATGSTNEVVIGYDVVGLGSNTTVLGNTSTTHGRWYGSLLLGTTTNAASSILTMVSTTQGFLPPRMTTTQKNAIASPATGLVVYDTTLNKLAVYTGAAWETVTSL